MGASILGYVMARDEWPILGLSVIHALNMGVSRVVVVDHGSTDATPGYVRRLQDAIPDRMVILRNDHPDYLQEETCRLVLRSERAEQYDWVYVFDADEFALTGSGERLPDLLGSIPGNVDAVRYELDQFVAPCDMDDQDLRDFSRIRTRSFPNNFLAMPGDLQCDELARGGFNFFDMPFPSKVIIRGSSEMYVGSGAHQVKGAASLEEMRIDTARLRVAHLPLLSRRRLELKSKQGAALVQAGFPKGHGWQSQAIRQVHEANLLDDFWRVHSISQDITPTPRAALPALADDDALPKALECAAAQLRQLLSEEAPPVPAARPSARVALGSAIAVVRDIASEHTRELMRLRDALDKSERLLREQASIFKERDTAVVASHEGELASAFAEMERNRLAIERLKSSLSWRLTAPLRRIGRALARQGTPDAE